MADEDETQRNGLLQSAMDEFIAGTRAVVNLVASVGSGALGALPEPVPATVTKMLGSLQQLVDQAPPFTAEFDVLVEELHAQRLTVAALQAELSAFDHQLEVIEKSLAPLESWAHQWTRLRASLTEALHSAAQESEERESAGQKPAGQKSTGQKPAGQKPAGQKPTGQKPTGQKPTGQKPAGQKSAGQKSAGQKSAGQK